MTTFQQSTLPKSSLRETTGRSWLLVPLLVVASLLALACQPVAPYGGGNFYNPIGSLDLVAGGAGEVRVAGWAAEWFAIPAELLHGPEPTRIVVMLDGNWVAQAWMADKPRPDVDAMFVSNPKWDPYHTFLPYVRPGAPYGFDFTVTTTAGEHTVCVVALNTAHRTNSETWDFGGDHVLLGCRTVTVT